VNIVLPVYNEQEVILLFHKELESKLLVLEEFYDFKIIYVNDGSTDTTREILNNIDKSVPTTIINLSRNFGHQAALSCGLDHCEGDIVITMDADMQHPPSVIKQMLEKSEEGYEIVFTLRNDSESPGFFKRITSKYYYRLFNAISPIKIRKSASDFRLISSKVLKVFQNDLREKQRFLRGLNSWVGFKSADIIFNAPRREKGSSKFSLVKMLSLATGGLTSFSQVPLLIGVGIGVVMLLLSLVYLILSIVYGLITNKLVPGWSSIILLMIILSAIQFLLIGILGLYIRDILVEVKDRPIYLVDEIDN